MIWLSWRQQRTETLVTAVLLGLLAALAAPAAIHLASLYTHDGIAACIHRQTAVCEDAVGSFGDHAGTLRTLAGGWLNLLPGLVGIALAAPLVLDIEHGTSTFAWTQSVTRARWLSTRLGLALLTALAAGGAYSLLLSWYRSPLDKVFGPFSDGAFDAEGVVPLAYILFALGLGLAVGMVLRRTAPAMVVAFLGYFGARIFVDTWLRQRFVTPLTATWGPPHQGPDLGRAWILFEGPSNRAGHVFSGSFRALQHCASAGGPGPIKSVNHSCLARLGYGFNHAVYQPASRFWEFQGIEAALFAGLGLVLIAFAAWRVLSSD
jgi:hypothetical protein